MNRHSFTFIALAAGLTGSFAGCSSESGTSPDNGDETAAAISTEKNPYPVDFPAKKRPEADARTAATLQYYGGPVIANPKVYVVWWGDPSHINASLTAAHGGIADFFAGITNSKYMDWLNEYDTAIPAQVGSHKGSAGTGQHIGRGNYAGTITLSSIPSGNVTDDQIQATLGQAVQAGTLPQPDGNTLFAIYFPPGVSITLDGSQSCFAFGAYHFATNPTSGPRTYYAVMPDCGSSFNGFTDVTSHELIEAVTDAIPTPGSNPDFPQAWNDSGGSEAGDLCEGTSGTVKTALGSFTVQGIWDEASHGCKTFRSYTRDYSVAFPNNTASFRAGGSATATVKTATVKGAAQPLTLSVIAPPGVTASIQPTTLTSGASATLTVHATSALSAAQVVVLANGTTGSAAQTHSAALLVNVSAQ